MNLGDVSNKTVPKVSLLAPAKDGGAVTTRTFIPTRVHDAIGVFGAVSVATACLLEGSVADDVAGIRISGDSVTLDIEHPTGYFSVTMDVSSRDGEITINSAALLRTARLLMRGEAYVPSSTWESA